MSEFDRIWEKCRPHFSQKRIAERARRLLLSQLTCLGRHTVTGMLCAGGRQFVDWSADYRLFERKRIDENALFTVAQREVEATLGKDQPLVVAMDDSLLRKTGKHVHGAGWRRDPLGPPFHVNFVWGQRVLQISAALPGDPGEARMIPIDFQHVPPAPKLPPNPSESEKKRHRQESRQRMISLQGCERLEALRERTDVKRCIWATVDGRFTNRTVLKNLPDSTVLIGRIRKDAKLYGVPDANPKARGRRRVYGDPLPTPEQLRQDESVPWQLVEATACGKTHEFRVKTLDAVRWKAAGEQTLRLLVIAPLRYQKTKTAKPLYRQPAYIICTDPAIPLEELLQAYIWRWDIEVNFRDEKTVLGAGQAQVRTPTATQKTPAFQVLAYSFLLLAAAKAYGAGKRSNQLPPPLWQKSLKPRRASTNDLVNLLRHELWSAAMNSPNFNHFCPQRQTNGKPLKSPNIPRSAVFYARA